MYGRYPRRKKVEKSKKQKKPQLKSLEKLPLSDLKKIRRSYERYLENDDLIEQANLRIRKENQIIEQKKRNQSERISSDEAKIRIQENLIDDLYRQLLGKRENVIRGIFADTLAYAYSSKFEKLKNSPETRILIKKHEDALRQLKYLKDTSQKYEKFDLQKELIKKTMSTMLINGSNIEVDFENIDIERLDYLIEYYEGLEEEKKETIRAEKSAMAAKMKELKIRVANNDKDTRKLAKKFKNGIINQLELLPCCPYCHGELEDSNAHQDHIYPVSKGGKSLKDNLVFVCASCNMKKGKYTLRNFIEQEDLDMKKIYENLRVLNKDF